jgi:hypothetical protein
MLLHCMPLRSPNTLSNGTPDPGVIHHLKHLHSTSYGTQATTLPQQKEPQATALLRLLHTGTALAKLHPKLVHPRLLYLKLLPPPQQRHSPSTPSHCTNAPVQPANALTPQHRPQSMNNRAM